MHRFKLPVWSLNKTETTAGFTPEANAGFTPEANAGFTLVELLVTLVILSIMAVAALPYAEVTVRRNSELELRSALREMRGAIDRLHEDWRAGRLPKTSTGVSRHGYPDTLNVLVEGVKGSDGVSHKYLRRIPQDPTAANDLSVDEQWLLRSYQDDHDSDSWGGEDVFDVRSRTDKEAINGSSYANW